jgi:hypothetical protein
VQRKAEEANGQFHDIDANRAVMELQASEAFLDITYMKDFDGKN